MYVIVSACSAFARLEERTLKEMQIRTGVKSGRMYRERVAAVEVKSVLKRIVFEATTTYVEKYGRQGLERHWCAKESPKMLPIDAL